MKSPAGEEIQETLQQPEMTLLRVSWKRDNDDDDDDDDDFDDDDDNDVIIMFVLFQLQVYPCNRRSFQPTFGRVFTYFNVLPVFCCIHSCTGNSETDILNICVII